MTHRTLLPGVVTVRGQLFSPTSRHLRHRLLWQLFPALRQPPALHTGIQAPRSDHRYARQGYVFTPAAQKFYHAQRQLCLLGFARFGEVAGIAD